MKFFEIFAKLVPFIFQAVAAAELLFNREKAGAEKKAAVKLGVKAIYDGAQNVSTGGQEETLEKLEPLVDTAIDTAAALLFPH